MTRQKRDIEERFLSLVNKQEDGCWLWTGSEAGSGYGSFTFAYKKKCRTHRLAYQLYIGPIPKGMLVCHKCDVRLCVRPDHLFLGTPKDNIQDCKKKGRLRFTPRRGEHHGNAKLTDANVREIKELLMQEVSVTAIAQQFGVAYATIYSIKIGKIWKHIKVSRDQIS